MNDNNFPAKRVGVSVIILIISMEFLPDGVGWDKIANVVIGLLIFAFSMSLLNMIFDRK